MTISQTSLEELQEIIRSDYGLEVDLESVRDIGLSLINIYSAILDNNEQKGKYEA